MRARGFTLIEVMAVVMLIGLAAGAVAFSMAGQIRAGGWSDGADRMAAADAVARLAARRTGRGCTLRFDLDRQEVVRVMGEGEGEGDEAVVSHRMRLPEGVRVGRMVMAPVARAGAAASGRGRGIDLEQGVVELPVSEAGHSASYAFELVSGGDGERVRGWVVVAGMSGQTCRVQDDETVHALFELLSASGSDAD